MRVLYEDTRQQMHGGVDKHAIKHKWWEENGIQVVRKALTVKSHREDPTIAPAGDYCVAGSNICVDTKANVDEVAGNINGKQHKRFISELQRAAQHGYRIVILVENELGYTNTGDVLRWTNGHCAKCPLLLRVGGGGSCNPRAKGKCKRHDTQKPIQGTRLYKAMETIEKKYGCRFEFCAPKESARMICEILGVKYD